MYPTTAVTSLAVASLIRGGARLPPPPPTPQIGIDSLQVHYEAYWRLSEPVRFFISGNAGNVVFYYLERVVSFLLTNYVELSPGVEEFQDSLSFFIAYILQVVTQHWLHALLVYGLHTIDTREKYFKTLGGVYSAYMVSLIGSTLLNMLFITGLNMNKTLAFIITLWTFAIINYFVIGWMVRKGQETDVPVDAKKRALDLKKKKEDAAKKRAAEMKKKAAAEKKKKAEEVKRKAAEAKRKAAELKKKQEERTKKLEDIKKKQAAAAKKTAGKPRGGAQIPFSACTESSDLLYSFVTSVSEPVSIDNFFD